MTAAWPLYGHNGAEQSFLEAHATGKLHHAWLIEGPSGIGKSRMAHRLGAWILGARGPDTAPVDATGDDPVLQKLMAGAHPDFRILQREVNDKGKLKQDISVDQARALNHFFELKPAMGGWRVGIIDSLDEFNRSASNAILKTLEEPPAQCVLFLINHGSQPILPTLRSRCRTLRLAPLSEADTALVLGDLDAPKEALRLSAGRPGRGLRLASPTGQAAASAARTYLRAMPKPPDNAMTAALRAGSADATAFEAFCAEILSWLADKADTHPAAAKTWLETSRLAGETDELNMPPPQATAKIIAGLSSLSQTL